MKSVCISLPIEATLASGELVSAGVPPIPHYLEQVYWWAYVHPKAVRIFEREWLVNAILFGHYGRLRDAALAELGATVEGRTLQIACVYGNLTSRLRDRMASDAQLDVVDILPVQLKNLRNKLPPDARIALLHGDASSLACADANYDQVLLFFLLHEMPQAVRRATLGEAIRVLKPGGKLVIVDYHRPTRWHPMRPLMRWVFRRLEPYAMDLWRHEVREFMPQGVPVLPLTKHTYFGRLYQVLAVQRPHLPLAGAARLARRSSRSARRYTASTVAHPPPY